jgi:hypothetical protein
MPIKYINSIASIETYEMLTRASPLLSFLLRNVMKKELYVWASQP